MMHVLPYALQSIISMMILYNGICIITLKNSFQATVSQYTLIHGGIDYTQQLSNGTPV